jgi:hypothetical protein
MIFYANLLIIEPISYRLTNFILSFLDFITFYNFFDSAGVGRTGTYIALDFLTEQGKAMGYIDVLGTITAFRSQRVCLVQTLV